MAFNGNVIADIPRLYDCSLPVRQGWQTWLRPCPWIPSTMYSSKTIWWQVLWAIQPLSALKQRWVA